MRFERKRTRAALAVAAALPLVAGALALGAQSATAAQPAGRQLLSGTKPQWATAHADKGATSDSGKVTVRVYLAGKDASGLAAYAKAVSDPNSADYAHYLTAAQAKARFGATKAQTDAITAWLTSAGLKVTGTNAHYLTVTGEVKAAEKAFGTQLHNYTKAGHTYRAPSSTASAPAALKGAVLTVTGLDNAPKRASHDDTLPPPRPPSPTPARSRPTTGRTPTRSFPPRTAARPRTRSRATPVTSCAPRTAPASTPARASPSRSPTRTPPRTSSATAPSWRRTPAARSTARAS